MEEIGMLLIRYVLFAIADVIILFACFQYLRNTKKLDSILLFYGSLIGFIAYTVGTFNYFSIDIEASDLTMYGYISTVVAIVGLISSTSFAIGLYILIRNLIKNTKSSTVDTINELGGN